jgi:hypothetical protein
MKTRPLFPLGKVTSFCFIDRRYRGGRSHPIRLGGA